jgi:hypothetical protein
LVSETWLLADNAADLLLSPLPLPIDIYIYMYVYNYIYIYMYIFNSFFSKHVIIVNRDVVVSEVFVQFLNLLEPFEVRRYICCKNNKVFIVHK